LTDTDGRLLAVEVHAADVQDRDGAHGVLARSRRRWPLPPEAGSLGNVERAFADAGHAGRLVDRVAAMFPLVLDIVRRPKGEAGFVLLPRRWVIERGFARAIERRRLIRDHEGRLDVAETMLTIAAADTLLRRVT
jgi:putative transposase